MLPCWLAAAPMPKAIAEIALALALKPNAMAASAVAFALMPTAVAPVPGFAVAPEPQANWPLPAFCMQFAVALGGVTVWAYAIAAADSAIAGPPSADKTGGRSGGMHRMGQPLQIAPRL